MSSRGEAHSTSSPEEKETYSSPGALPLVFPAPRRNLASPSVVESRAPSLSVTVPASPINSPPSSPLREPSGRKSPEPSAQNSSTTPSNTSSTASSSTSQNSPPEQDLPPPAPLLALVSCAHIHSFLLYPPLTHSRHTTDPSALG